ncbi:MAG: nucleotide exchange factor GrpE [Terriglobia bacterium]|jgi:molecular chaperone GrpE
MDQEREAILPANGEAAEPSAGAENGAPASEPAGGGEDLSALVEKLRAEKDAFYDRLLRKQAELENLRKRTQREREDFLQHATADLILALLPTLDAFDRALRHREATVPEQFYQGLELIHRELTDVLSRAGLTALDTLGKTFDPHLHQAVETVEAPDHRDQEIVEELQRGYKLKQRLLRPAVVKIAVAKRS